MNEGAPRQVLIFCPSKGQECGIARYSEYVSSALNERGGYEASVVGTIKEAEELSKNEDLVILYQHEYGIYDRNSNTYQAPSTSEFLILNAALANKSKSLLSCLIMHTLHPSDHLHAFTNMQLLSSGIPVYHLNSMGAGLHGLNYLEHGVYKQSAGRRNVSEAMCFLRERYSKKLQRNKRFVIGTFGLLSPNKNLNSLIDLAAAADVDIIANLATKSKSAADELRRYASRANVNLRLTTDFATEEELSKILVRADFCVSLQDEIKHFATSGSARFMLSIGNPLLTTSCRQFSDLGAAVIQVTHESFPKAIDELRSHEDYYLYQAKMGMAFTDSYEIGNVYHSLIKSLKVPDVSTSITKFFFASGEHHWKPSFPLWSPGDVPESITSDSNSIQSAKDLLIHSAKNRLSQATDPIKRFGGLTNFTYTGDNGFVRSSVIRRLASFHDIQLTYAAEVGKIGQSEFKRIYNKLYRAMRSITNVSYSDRHDIIDEELSPGFVDEAPALLPQELNEWLLNELLTSRPLDGCVYQTLISVMYVQSHHIPSFLKLLLPSMTIAIDDFIARNCPPPLRISKRWKWLNELYDELGHQFTSNNKQVFFKSSSTSLLRRYFYFIEEFLWVMDCDFAAMLQLCFCKQVPDSVVSSKIVKVLNETGDTPAARLDLIIEHLTKCFWELGYPVALLTYLPTDPESSIAYSRARRHAKFFSEHSVQMINCLFRVGRSPFRGHLIDLEEDHDMTRKLNLVSSTQSGGFPEGSAYRIRNALGHLASTQDGPRVLLP